MPAGGILGRMHDLARQRAATCAVWRVDALSRPGGDAADLGGVHVHTTGLDVLQWNGAHLQDASGLRRLPQVRDWFAVRREPWALVVPAELDLEPPAMSHVHDLPVMLRPLTPLTPLTRAPAVQIRWDAPVEHVAALQAEAFEAELELCRAFVLPKLTNAACATATAYDDGVPVATAQLFVVDGVAGVYGVAVPVRARRRGLGAAVTSAVLHRAAALGCDLAFLNPSELGHGMYGRLGFVDSLPWRIWAPA